MSLKGTSEVNSAIKSLICGQTESNKVTLDSEGSPYGEIDLESEEDFCDEEGKGSIILRGWIKVRKQMRGLRF